MMDTELGLVAAPRRSDRSGLPAATTAAPFVYDEIDRRNLSRFAELPWFAAAYLRGKANAAEFIAGERA